MTSFLNLLTTDYCFTAIFLCVVLSFFGFISKRKKEKHQQTQDLSLAHLPPKKDYYFTHGDYVVEIRNTRIFFDHQGKVYAFFDCLVENCSNASVRIGSLVTWFAPIDRTDLKQNIANILSLQSNTISNEHIRECLTLDSYSGKSSLVGKRCHVHSRLSTTQKGNHFIKVDFFNIHNKQTTLGH